MASSIHQINFIKRRKEQGLCLSCGNPLDRDGTYCTPCLKEKNETQRLDRHFYQEHGICPRCRKNELFGDEKNCPECAAKEYSIIMPKRTENREHYNELHKEWSKKEYDRRKEVGICTRCGKRKAENGHYTCGICREKERRYKRKRYGKPNRSDRIEEGLCYFCDNHVKSGYKVCEKHYQRMIDMGNLPQAKEARKKISSDWIFKVGDLYGKRNRNSSDLGKSTTHS